MRFDPTTLRTLPAMLALFLCAAFNPWGCTSHQPAPVDADGGKDASAEEDAQVRDPDRLPNPWQDLAPRGMPVGAILGMATQMYDGPEPQWEREFEIEKLREAGLLRLRASIDWEDVEPEQDEWQFGNTDAFVRLVTDAGLQFDARLCYGVDWARPDGNDSTIRPEDFADYAGTVAARYCGTIGSYEIWNEENLATFWKPEPDPDAYGRLLKATYRAIHGACPEARVVFGGLSCFDTDIFSDGLYHFLDRVHAFHPDIGEYFDALAIHPYTFLQQTEPEWSLQIGRTEMWPDLPGQIRTARARLASLGHPSLPIWITEYGWPSLLIGNEAQAAYLVRGALLAIAEGVEALDWYTFWDGDGTRIPPTEDYFGLFTSPAAPGGPVEKPAFRAARALAEILGEARFAGELSNALELPEGVFGLAFVEEKTGQRIFAGWDARPGRVTEIALPCPPGSVHYEGLDAEGISVFRGPGVDFLPIQLTGQVLYIRFEMR